MKKAILGFAAITLLAACSKDDDTKAVQTTRTITIENVLDSKPLVETGSFKRTATNLLQPGDSVKFTVYAKPGQYLSFATMYGWSNDLFFAPASPGIKLYNDDKSPVNGDVSSQIKLWDNGTKTNDTPGASVNRNMPDESPVKNIKEVVGKDDFNHTYLSADKLMKVTLANSGKGTVLVTIKNISGGTANATPFSPGVWTISHALGDAVQLPNPIYSSGALSANGLTKLAQMGDTLDIINYLKDKTGLFTPLSPVMIVVYNGTTNPFFKVGEKDRGQGLKNIAQMGDATTLADALKKTAGVKNVYIVAEPTTKILLPKTAASVNGGKVNQQIMVADGDRIAIATMFGFSNDWFFATSGNDIEATKSTGDVTGTIKLFDNGTAVNQMPGANNNNEPESNVISEVTNPTKFITLPAVSKIIKVTLQ